MDKGLALTPFAISSASRSNSSKIELPAPPAPVPLLAGGATLVGAVLVVVIDPGVFTGTCDIFIGIWSGWLTEVG